MFKIAAFLTSIRYWFKKDNRSRVQRLWFTANQPVAGNLSTLTNLL